MTFFNFIQKITPQAFRTAVLKTYLRYEDALRPRREVELSRLMLGDYGGMDANRFSRIIADPLLPSTPIERWPHTLLLQDYKRLGSSVLSPEVFFKTEYAQKALLCIDVTGKYFDAQTPEDIIRIAKSFLDRFAEEGSEEKTLHKSMGEGHSRVGQPVLVRPISHSDCFQVVDGHHRLAIQWESGTRRSSVAISGKPVTTPLQQMIRDSTWSRGSLELYQPIDARELEKEWLLVRRCTDRLEKMLDFLQKDTSLVEKELSFLDVGSNYGWFIGRMSESGYNSFGIERDPMACRLATLINGVSPDHVFQSEVIRFLRTPPQKYDIVSCLSLIHHFARGMNSVSATELLRLLDSITSRVLFLDMGQSHEAWFKNSLQQWDVEYIEQWILRESSFKSVSQLGTDIDNVPPFADNYGRMLFACTR